MAKLNMYTQQTRAQGGQMSAEAMGSDVGQAAGQMGSTLADIGMAITRRENVIDRVQLTNTFDQAAITDLEAIQADSSIAAKETVTKYTSTLRQRADEVLGKHIGNSASRAELRAQLENQIGQYTKSATGAQIKAQYTLIGQAADKLANQYTISATTAPDQMVNALAQFESNLMKFDGSVAKDQMDAFRQDGRSRIITGAVSGLMQTGNYTKAQELLNDPNISGAMSADTVRGFSIDIAVDGAKQQAEVKRQNDNVASYTMALGRDLTPKEMMIAKSLPSKQSDMTVADKINQLELVTGRPATQFEVDNIMGATPAFGSSLQGRALSFVQQNAVAYANGMLSPDQARMFEMSYAEAYKPIEKQDPESGLWTKIKPSVPAFVQQAMSRGSAIYGGGLRSAPPAAAPAAPAAPAAAPAAPMGGAPMATAPAAAQAAPAAQQAAPAAQQDRSIWSRSENIAGVQASAMQAAGRVPVIGEAVDGGGVFAQDRQFADASSKSLIRALSNSGRYAVGEMQSIEKEVSISGSTFDNPAAYKQRLIGIDEALAKRVKDAQSDLTNPKISIEKRRQANDVIAEITNFRQTLGVPPRVKSVKEALELAPGSEFIDPTGKVRVVPAQR